MSQQWNPLQDLMFLQDRMNRLFEDATDKRARQESNTRDDFEGADWTPAADIHETESGYQIVIDLPGVGRDAVEIDLDDNRLLVKGTRAVDESARQSSERPFGKFFRSFTVPGSVDPNQIGAEYKDGVLFVRLPKRKEPKSQRVAIKIS
jgi:HSP20 family protein